MGLKNFFGQLLLSFAVEVLAMDVLLLGREEKMKPIRADFILLVQTIL